MATSSISPRLTSQKLCTWMKANSPLIAELVRLRKFEVAEKLRVAAYEKPILERYAFRAERTGEVITQSGDLYLVEGDEERLAAFYEECADAHAANGWTGERGYCPALVAQRNTTEHEWKVLPKIATLLGVTQEQFDANYQVQRKALDLVVAFYQDHFALSETIDAIASHA